MVTDDELAEIRMLRGQGWSQQRIANELDLSRQTIGYQLKKLSLETSSSKPVRVIHTKSVSIGPRVFTLEVRDFERERQNGVVYQINSDVYELRSGCMHHTRLEGDASGCDYSDWVSLMQKVRDTSILEKYRSEISRFAKDKIDVSDDWFKFLKPDFLKKTIGYRNHKKGKAETIIPNATSYSQTSVYKMIINGNEYRYSSEWYGLWPQTSIFGLEWLDRNGEDPYLFNDIDINSFLREVIDEHIQSVSPMEVKLTGNAIKDTLEIHERFGSYEGMVDSLTPARVFLSTSPTGRLGGKIEDRWERQRTRFVNGIIREAIERMRQTESSKTD